MPTRELTTEHVHTILPRWYARYLLLPYEDPSKSDCEVWIEDAMINIFCHQTINESIGFPRKLFKEFADVADILLD